MFIGFCQFPQFMHVEGILVTQIHCALFSELIATRVWVISMYFARYFVHREWFSRVRMCNNL